MTIIYISGIDGCGKTTQAQRLASRLNSSGKTAEYQWLRWEPSILPVIRKIKGLLSGKKRTATYDAGHRVADENSIHTSWKRLKRRLLSSKLFQTMWLFYATRDYYIAYRKARSTWKSDYIILDRYLYDFVVDQALNLGREPGVFQQEMENTALRHAQKPDFTVIIDIPAELGYTRKRDGTALEYLKEREAIYNNFSAADNVLHIDGAQSPEAIHELIYAWISRRNG